MQRVSAPHKQSWGPHRLLAGRGARRRLRGVCVCAIFVLAGLALHGQSAPASNFPVDAIGRLIVDDRGSCTAFVIRSIERRTADRFGGGAVLFENWVASAGHCVGTDLVLKLGGATHRIGRVLGYSSGRGGGFDVMVASFVTYSRIAALEPAFGEYPAVGDPLLLIGYGGKALMMRVGPLVRYDDRGYMEIHSYASRGNSGGPVLIPGTRRVVGIGIETTVDRPAGANSMYCMVAGCAVKPPYVASHIDALKGVADFR